MLKNLKNIAKSIALVLTFSGLGVIGSSVSAYLENTTSAVSSDYKETELDKKLNRLSFMLDMARTDYVSIPDSVTVNRDEEGSIYKAIAVRGSDVLRENSQKGATLTKRTLGNYLNEVWNKVKDAPNLYSPLYNPKDTANSDDYDRNACISLKGEVDGTSIAKSGENWAVNLKKEQKNINGVDLYEFTLELPKELDDKLNSDEKFKFTIYRTIVGAADKKDITKLELGSSCLMNTHPELVKNKTPIGPFLMDVAIHSFERGQQFFVDAGEKQAAACNKLEKNLKQSNKTVLTKEEVDKALAEVESTIANDVPQGDLVAIFGE